MKMRILLLISMMLLTIAIQGCLPIVAAGVGTGVIISQDRRNNDIIVEDQNLESSINNELARDFTGVMHVNVTSYNFSILLTGEVPEEFTKAEIGKVAASFKNVRNIHNELVVSKNSSLISRSNDSLITSNVKLRFLNNDHFRTEHIKVITENSTVFLLGLVSQAAADAAAEIASTTKGVQRVVKLFEYRK